jgi:hypothetical protein
MRKLKTGLIIIRCSSSVYKKTSKKFAILTMITCVLSVLAFLALVSLNLMYNWPA